MHYPLQIFMKSKSLFSAVLTLAVFSQFSFPVFAADANQEFFDKAWDNTLNSQHDTTVCKVSVPFSRIDPKIINSLSATESQRDRLNLEALRHYTKYYKTVFNQNGNVLGYVTKIFDAFPMAVLFGDGSLTYKQAVAAMSATDETNVETLNIGDKVYYRLDNGWNVFEDHAYADNAYKNAAADPNTNFVEKSSFVFDQKMNDLSVYNGNGSDFIKVALLKGLIGNSLAEVAPSASAQLFVGPDGFWKKLVIDARFNAYDITGMVREVCTFDFSNRKARAPANAKAIDSASGIKAIGG